MGRAIYAELGGKQYNKGQFAKKWKEIVAGYELDISLSGEDRDFFISVCQRIERFRKILNKPGTPQFKVTRKEFNGKKVRGIVLVSPSSRTEVWVGKAYSMERIFPRTNLPDPAKVNRQNAIKALRNIIQPQIDLYKKKVSGQVILKSSLSGKPILGAYHVDHVYPFIRMVEEWCRENSIDLETIPVKCLGVTCRLESVEMSESWFDYHALNASYQILDPVENISKGCKYYGSSS